MASETQRIVLGSEIIAALEASKQIDTRGLVCPYPSFETAKLVGSALENEVLEILSDDKYAALNSIPTVLRLRNFECAVLESDDGVWRIKARRRKAVLQ